MPNWISKGLALLIAVAAVGCGSTAQVPTPTPSPAPLTDLCLRGEYRALPSEGVPVSGEALDMIVLIIGKRLADYGLVQSQFRVETQGTDRVAVQLAAVPNEQEVRNLIGANGKLEFIGVPPERTDDVQVGQPIPADLPVILDGSHVEEAYPAFTQAGQRAVDVTFSEEGALLFDSYAAGHFGEQFAIALDGVVQSAPVIQAARFGRYAQISGAFATNAEAYQLVTVLRSGPLPNPIEEVSFTTC